jgi:hypothetical protein
MLVINDRLSINRGEDKDIIFKIREKNSRDPINLNGVTTITIELDQANRQKLILDTVLRPAVKASITIQGVKIIADNAGGIGNSVILNFNDVDDLDTIVNEWNTNNPVNTISHNGEGDEIFNGQFRLSGGLEAYSPVTIDSDPLLGRIKLHLTELDSILLRRGNNQTITIIIDWGYPPSGTRRIAKFDNKLDVIG